MLVRLSSLNAPLPQPELGCKCLTLFVQCQLSEIERHVGPRSYVREDPAFCMIASVPFQDLGLPAQFSGTWCFFGSDFERGEEPTMCVLLCVPAHWWARREARL